MLYTPGTIATADKPIARKHSVGGEKRLYITRDPVNDLGTLLLAGDGSGVWTADAINTPPTAGSDLQAVVETWVESDTAAVLTVVGTKSGGGSITGTATLNPPGWAVNNSYDFQPGAAWDLTVAAADTYATITSVSITNAKKWSSLKLFQLPATTNYKYVDTVENVTPRIGNSPGHPIPDLLDGSAEVTLGRSDPSELRITAKHRSIVDGLARYAGRPCTLRLEVWKQGRVLVERHVFGNAILQVNPEFGDGSDDVKQAAEGIFEQYFGFYAP